MSEKQPRVGEAEARAAYIVMEGRRGVPRLRAQFVKAGRKPPSQRAFEEWRRKHDWVRLAKEHDAKVVAAAAAQIAKTATRQVVTRVKQFDTLATESLQAAIDGLKALKVKSLKANDIRALAEVSVSAARMVELLEGRATERKDDLTRQDMDKMMEDMADELNERLKFTSDTIH